MTDLNALLKDFKDKRLAYKEINRAAHEALMDGIVAEIEALKAHYDGPTRVTEAELLAMLDQAQAPKRGPGRPPKAEASTNG